MNAVGSRREKIAALDVNRQKLIGSRERRARHSGESTGLIVSNSNPAGGRENERLLELGKSGRNGH
jgi:hypothetical protein